MNSAAHTFTYRSKLRSCFSYAAGWGVLFAVEVAVFSVAILAIFSSSAVRLILIGALIIATMATVVLVLLRPIFTHHILTDTELHLRYGPDRVDIPLLDVRSATKSTLIKAANFSPSIRFDRKLGMAVLTFSDFGLVEIELNSPHSLGLKDVPRPVDRLLLNVDNPEEFIAMMSRRLRQAPEGPLEIVQATSDSKTLDLVSATGQLGRTDGDVLLRMNNLSRDFGGRRVVDSVNLEVVAGEIYGFLGLNGAGKSTTIKMIVGLLAPSTGDVTIKGHSISFSAIAAKTHYGYAADRAMLYERLTGREYLEFLASLRDLPIHQVRDRIEFLLAALDLGQSADLSCGDYSYGMKRKLATAGALLHRPAVLILDEPFNGLDPRSTKKLQGILRDEADRGCAILLSTHDLFIAETLCDRVGIIHGGRLIIEGSSRSLRDQLGASSLDSVFHQLTESSDFVEAV